MSVLVRHLHRGHGWPLRPLLALSLLASALPLLGPSPADAVVRQWARTA